MTNLFSPITIRNITIKNRIVMPPMCFVNAGDDGQVTDTFLSYYAARAMGGVGLIIIQATCVDKQGRLAPGQLGLWSDDQIPGFSRLAQVCHQNGAKVLVQIHHAGMSAPDSVTSTLVAPSDYHGIFKGKDISARALTLTEIHTLQSQYLAATLRAQKAGVDGVELHGAHGFLISQFFSSQVNKRSDVYGGNIENRTRFLIEILSEIKETTGEDFIVGCRMGCNEPDLRTSIEIAKILEESGVDLLHISTGIGSPQETSQGFNHNWIVYGGTEIKKHVKVPVIVVNGIRIPEQAESLVEKGMADFTAIGIGLIVDPEWPNKAQRHQPVIPCIDCQPCELFKPGGTCVQYKSAN